MAPQKNCERVSIRTIRQSTRPFLLGFAWLFHAKTAHAEPPHYRVELSVPPNLPECNREPELLGMVVPMVMGSMLDPPASRVITVRIAKKQPVYHLNLVVKDVDGKQIDELHSELPATMSCFEVLYRGALRAALHINLQSPPETKAPPPPAAPPPPPAAPPQCPKCQKSKSEPPKPAPIERRWFIGAGGMVGFGIAPEIVAGMQFVVGRKWSPSWSLELDARATIPQDTRPLGPTIVHIYTVASATIAPCYRIDSFGFCGLVNGTNVWAGSTNVNTPRFGSAASFGVGGRGFFEHHLSDRWSLRFDADIVAPMLRMQLEDTPLARWAPPPISGSFAASMFVWF